MKPWMWIALGLGAAVLLLKPKSALAKAQEDVDIAMPVGDCQDACVSNYANGNLTKAQYTACIKACGSIGL